MVNDPGWLAGWNRSSQATVNLTAGQSSAFTLFGAEAMPNVLGRLFVSRSAAGAGSANAAITVSAGGFFSNNGTAQSYMGLTSVALAATTLAYFSGTGNVANVLPQFPLLAVTATGTDSAVSLTIGALFAGTNL